MTIQGAFDLETTKVIEHYYSLNLAQCGIKTSNH